MRNARSYALVLSILALLSQVLWSGPAPALHAEGISRFVPVPLQKLCNNSGIGSAPGRANFDGAGNAYPAGALHLGSTATLDGVTFDLAGGPKDNVVALGQTVSVPRGTYASAFFLVAASSGEAVGTVIVHYANGSTSRAPLGAPDWSKMRETPAVAAPHRLGPQELQGVPAGMFVEQVWLDRTRRAISITLPRLSPVAPQVTAMHIFALSLVPSVSGDAVSLLRIRSTGKRAGDGAQVIQADLQNTGSVDHTSANPLTVTLAGPGVAAVQPEDILRLAAGDEVTIEVGVRPASGTPAGTTLPLDMVVRSGDALLDSQPAALTVAAVSYTATEDSLSAHETPDWYDGAKFGIFIHYGLYSIPAWAPVGGVYAEWYWHSMEQKGSPTYLHQLKTYGSKFQYDDFIARFTATKFHPRAWVTLLRQSGAKYFVMVSKHHDGYALFRTRYSKRNSVDSGPHRDLVGALLSAARKYAPGLHTGLYYSLPEWFNPAYPGIQGKRGQFTGGPPRNYVTGSVIPYTGFTPVGDYVRDYQAPQMLELIDRYHPDILWCDIGGENDSLRVLAHFYNQALLSGQQVAVNNRCGVSAHDFSTPEYKVYPMTVHAKWETSRGLDPHSYGYNANTPDKAYASAGSVVRQLVDVVSKNGNLLLDIGPRGDGSIPRVMKDRLRAIGSWLAVNGQAIYDTQSWWRTPADGSLRFTIRPNQAFYITSLKRPVGHVVVHEPVPLLRGDRVTLLGWSGGALHWTRTSAGLTIDVPPAAAKSGRYAWVFKVS